MEEVIELLEAKLADRERKIEELKKMNEELNNKISEILKLKEKEIEEIKNRVVEELAVQLKDEILSLKKEIDNEKMLNERIATLESKILELTKTIESLTKEILFIKSGKKINNQEPVRSKVKEHLKSSTKLEKEEEEEDDIIICD